MEASHPEVRPLKSEWTRNPFQEGIKWCLSCEMWEVDWEWEQAELEEEQKK